MKADEHWHEARVAAVEDLSPTVRGIAIDPGAAIPAWTVGSHLRVQVRLPDGRSDTRHYSLTGLPQASRAEGRYRIAVKRAQPGRGGSAFMAALRPGDAISIAGPDNHFELPVNTPHALLVAGGIGITPIAGMALALAARGVPLRMAYAARSDDELVFADTLRAVLGERLQTFIDTRGERLDLDAEITALPAGAHLLICGPVPLLQAAQAAWSRARRPLPNLRFETFGSSGHRIEQSFVVRVPRHGVEATVPADRSLLDVLAEHGVEALYDCRRGECGLCVLNVIAVAGEIDHRDVFFSAAEQREATKLCTCVSRVFHPQGAGVLTLDSAWRADEP